MSKIVPYLRSDAFDDEAVRLMGEAFDAACTQLGNISAQAREIVASLIIEMARRGERDPSRLLAAGLSAICPRH